MVSVPDPKGFIRANLDSKPSGLRQMLRDMQARKRQQGVSSYEKKMAQHNSLSAYQRTQRRRAGQPIEEEETELEKEMQKIMRRED